MLLKLVLAASADAVLLTEPPAEPLAVAEFEAVLVVLVLVTSLLKRDFVGSALISAVLPIPFTVTSLVAFLSPAAVAVVFSVDLNEPDIWPSVPVVAVEL